MKKAKLLVATVLASGLVLSGCTFEEGLEMAKNWPVQNVYEPAKAFFEEKILGKKPQEEPAKEKEEKEEEGEKPAPVAQLLSISVSGEFKTEYDLGEAFDSTGIVVTAVYDDESSKDVSAEASFSGFDSSAQATVTITVSFEGQTASFEVNVKARSYEFKAAKQMFADIEEIGAVSIPNYPGEDLDVTLDDDYLDKGDLLYYLKNTTHDDMDAYAALLEEAGWALEKDTYGDYSGTFGNTRAAIYLADYLDYSAKAIEVEFYVAPEKVDAISFEAIESYYASFGLDVEIPDYEGEGISCVTSESGLMFLIYDSSHEQMDTFAASMNTAGWNLTADSLGDYSGYYGDTGAYVEIEDWIGYYYDGILISFKYESDELSALKIMQDVGTAGWGYTEDGDFTEPDDNGIVESNYTIGASSYSPVDLADSEECLSGVLSAFVSDSDFPDYLEVLQGPTYTANAIQGSIGVSEIYLCDENMEFVLYMYDYYYNSKVSIVFMAGPADAFMSA